MAIMEKVKGTISNNSFNSLISFSLQSYIPFWLRNTIHELFLRISFPARSANSFESLGDSTPLICYCIDGQTVDTSLRVSHIAIGIAMINSITIKQSLSFLPFHNLFRRNNSLLSFFISFCKSNSRVISFSGFNQSQYCDF